MLTLKQKQAGIIGFRASGLHALIIDFDDNLTSHNLIHHLANQFLTQPLPDQINVLPATDSLTLVYDRQPDLPAISVHLDQSLEQTAFNTNTKTVYKTHTIEICYHSDLAPDLLKLSQTTGLSIETIIELHSKTIYRVDMLGFLPGFAYLDGLPDVLQVPRKATPSQQVAAGSVAIAEHYSAIYPLDSPGGWHVIGRTRFPCIDWQRQPFCPFSPNDRIQFKPISLTQWQRGDSL